MSTVIYADILVAVNMIVNYFLLRACTAVTGSDCKTVRIFLSSVAGGLFSMIIFIENISPLLNTAIKAVFLFIMVAIAFGVKPFKAFVKNCSSFFIANFVFAGLMLAFSVFIAPEKALYKNGIVYFDIDIVTLTVSAFVCYLILTVLTRFSRSRPPAESIYELTVTYRGRTATGKALYDTGNTLRDSFSGRPVIIAERSFAEKLFTQGEDVTQQKSFRLIPYSTIKNGGALPAFLAEKITLKTPLKTVEAERIFIAVTERKIVSGDFCALLGTPVTDAAGSPISERKERGLCLKKSRR